MGSDTPSQCANCGTPAFRKCAGCKINVYCGKNCQTLDWAKHKASCKSLQLERTLKRVAVLVHETYLTFREHTWDYPIRKVVETENSVIMFDRRPTLKQHFLDFLQELVKSAHSKMAVLCHGTCQDQAAFMAELLQELLKGLPVQVDEIEVGLLAPPRKTTAVLVDGTLQHSWPTYSHCLFRLSHTKSTARWVLDITGSQFGIYQPFWKWDDYANKFLNFGQHVKVYSFGASKAVLNELGKLDGSPSLISGVSGDVAKVIPGACATFERLHDTKLATLLQLSDSDFELKKNLMLALVIDAICNYKKEKGKEVLAKWRRAQDWVAKHPRLSPQECADITKRLCKPYRKDIE